MKRSELAAAISERIDVPEYVVGQVLAAVPLVMRAVLQSGGKVDWIGFGVFKYVFRAQRSGRNAANGERIPIPGKWSVGFKASMVRNGILRD